MTVTLARQSLAEATAIAQARSQSSNVRLRKFTQALRAQLRPIAPEDLFVFAAGSFARGEGGEHSDLDLFVARSGSSVENGANQVRLQVLGRIITTNNRLGFPPLSRDAAFLQLHSMNDMLKVMCTAQDDYINSFTFRMLLVLESTCLYGRAAYNNALETVINAYFRDYARHRGDFLPTFLLNDINRYRTTVAVNYESARGMESPSRSVNDGRAKNFKLRFSRMTTIFGTVAAIAALHPENSPAATVELASKTPWERLWFAAERMPSIRPDVEAAYLEYSWFLEQTALTADQLHAHLGDRRSRAPMQERARAYGGLLYHMMQLIDMERPDLALLRHWVI